MSQSHDKEMSSVKTIIMKEGYAFTSVSLSLPFSLFCMLLLKFLAIIHTKKLWSYFCSKALNIIDSYLLSNTNICAYQSFYIGAMLHDRTIPENGRTQRKPGRVGANSIVKIGLNNGKS